jgi:hypothetical protein
MPAINVNIIRGLLTTNRMSHSMPSILPSGITTRVRTSVPWALGLNDRRFAVRDQPWDIRSLSADRLAEAQWTEPSNLLK